MIEILTGPMWSGKTGELIGRIQAAEAQGLDVLAIKPSTDTRDVEIRSRTGRSYRCLPVPSSQLAQYSHRALEGGFLAIDEAQFFGPELLALAASFQRQGTLILAGLDRTSEGRPFGHLLEIAERAARVTFLRAYCERCGNAAPLTFYQGQKDQDVKIGNDGYEPRCSPCWEKGMGKKHLGPITVPLHRQAGA